jgi:hypothetical protein
MCPDDISLAIMIGVIVATAFAVAVVFTAGFILGRRTIDRYTVDTNAEELQAWRGQGYQGTRREQKAPPPPPQKR